MNLFKQAKTHFNELAVHIDDRSVGSSGNRSATNYFHRQLTKLGHDCEMKALNVMDWHEEGAELTCSDETFKLLVGPYSNPCNVKGKLYCASTLDELKNLNSKDDILLVHGELAKEQLMPKNFVFYNPEEHQQIIALMENSGVKAIISATGRNSAVAGGVYPFPLIEDGDFDIPNVYTTDIEGRKLINYSSQEVQLISRSKRIPANAYNCIAKIGDETAEKIVITAHIDAKKGSPGAIDNATGVVVLLLLAELLKNYQGKYQIELIAFNGEDYYAVPGQMDYIESRQGNFEDILLNINIDGAGYYEGSSTFSLFNLPRILEQLIQKIIHKFDAIEEGIQWVQGDHSIFIQFGRPAIAISSKWLIDHFDSQTITHTPKDNASIVNTDKLTDIALAIYDFINDLD